MNPANPGVEVTATSKPSMKNRRFARFARRAFAFAILAASAAAGGLAAPRAAWAQEFQKVDGKIADNVPAVPFVGIAYGVIWLAVLVYVISVARGLGRVNRDLDELRRKIDSAGSGAAGGRG